MFFQYSAGGMIPTEPERIDGGLLTVGYVNVEELTALRARFGFDETTVAACRDANTVFRSGVEVHADYTFTELRILNTHETADDYIALYVMRNLLLVVDIQDEDGSTRAKFLSAAERYSPDKVSCEKVLASFLEFLFLREMTVLENIELQIAEQEDVLAEEDCGKDFNLTLLRIKKSLSKRHSYYSQLLDITEAVYENDNDLFEESSLIYIDNVSKRLTRLREDAAALRGTVEHLQDAYSSWLDSRMNSTMKIFTVLTSIFFPLTIIVGWYGMNFRYMPELGWKYGYVYVIALSVMTVLVLVLVGRKKKWF